MSIIKKHDETIIAIILIVINFIIKGIFISNNSLGGDEPFSVYHAQMDITSIIRLLSQGNNPPLYEILLHFWIKLFGISELSVRFPSLIFSGITILYIYKLGTKFINKQIALYASIIFIFSNYHILFAHEARVYSLLGLLSVVSMYYYMNIIHYSTIKTKEENNLKSSIRQKLLILIIINTLIIYSHYFGFFILITQFVFVLFNKNIVSKYWKQILICSSIIGLLYLPNILIFLNRFVESSSNGTWVQKPNGIDSIYNLLRQFSNAPVVTVFVILILVSSLVKSIINKKSEVANIYYSLVVFWFVFIFFFMFIISYWVPMFMDRYLMPAAIAFSLVIGISIDYLIKSPKYKYTIPIIVCLMFILTVKPNLSNNRNVKETIDKIKNIKDAETLVLICPTHFILNFEYYYNKEVFKKYNTDNIYSNINQSINLDNIYSINNIQEIDFKKWNKVVFLDAAANFSYPDNNIKQELDKNYVLKNKFYFAEIFNIFTYEKKQ
jgi:uncharacterized membrane protein